MLVRRYSTYAKDGHCPEQVQSHLRHHTSVRHEIIGKTGSLTLFSCRKKANAIMIDKTNRMGLAELDQGMMLPPRLMTSMKSVMAVI